MENVLVTGCLGQIGSKVVERLGAVGITEDIRQIDKLRPFFKDKEFIVHCAVKKYNATDQEFYDINVTGTKNVIELCLENNCKLIHFGSTEQGGAYGITKQKSVDLVERCAKKGLRVIVLRLCAINFRGIKRDNRHYPIKILLDDIEEIIKHHDFGQYKIINYPK